MTDSDLALSVRPDRLSTVSDREVGIELKFDWEHGDLLRCERDLGAVLDGAGVDPSRVRSVHLPPGLEPRGDGVRMAVTRENRGAILDFVHGQLGAVPDAYLVAHPPKSFDYAAQFDLLASITASTGRALSIENTPDPSDWHTPEAMAFLAHRAATDPRLSDLWLTVDSAHLPRQAGGDAGTGKPRGSDPLAPDPGAVDAVERKARAEVPGIDDRTDPFEGVGERLPADAPALRAAVRDRPVDREYLPLLKTLLLCGDRVRGVHLNDPHTDTVPDVDPHREYPVLATCLDRHDGTVVFEAGDLWADPAALFDRIDRFREWDPDPLV